MIKGRLYFDIASLLVVVLFLFLLVRVITEDLNCSKNKIVRDRDIFPLHSLLLWHQIYLKMPCIHPSAIWLILFRVTGEAGREAGYNMDRSSIHDKATTHKQTNALTFTLSCYFEFPIHLSCKSLVCCRKLDHLEETPQTIKCPNKMTIHTDLIHAVKHVCCFLSVRSLPMFVCPVPQSKIILSVDKCS